jgi:hypothetical protein
LIDSLVHRSGEVLRAKRSIVPAVDLLGVQDEPLAHEIEQLSGMENEGQTRFRSIRC